MSGNGLTGRFRVLLVDDEKDLVDLLAFLVDQAGLIPLSATEPQGALELFEKEHPSLAVVDLNLRPWDGFELLAELRRRSPKMPILVLTARGAEDDKVRALDLGADDYVVKPFGHRELVARIKAQARRAELDGNGAPAAVLEVGPLRLDVRERTLQLDGHDLRLTGTEFRLLEYLMRNSNSVVPTAALAKYVWGYDDSPAREVVRVTVHRLRRKLGDDGQRRRFIETIPGVGLKLRPSVARQESHRS
ncbi:MAG: response regulator transcription factor [Chloroflexi bacterium]|nr:MAG: response regulator transcription factor [Chloroflexota bacterium]TMG72142.1 MAG: response regulator transcription factor [Chloroflexota bacterium]